MGLESIAVGDVVTFFELGWKIVNYLKNAPLNKKSQEIIDSLRRIYFERSTIKLLENLRETNKSDRLEIMRQLEHKLLSGRHEVQRSLASLEQEGLLSSLSIKQRRLLTQIRDEKVRVRSLIFYDVRALIEANNLKPIDSALDRILDQIKSLNGAIEEVEEKYLARKH
jgi:hypothetical protein